MAWICSIASRRIFLTLTFQKLEATFKTTAKALSRMSQLLNSWREEECPSMVRFKSPFPGFLHLWPESALGFSLQKSSLKRIFSSLHVLAFLESFQTRLYCQSHLLTQPMDCSQPDFQLRGDDLGQNPDNFSSDVFTLSLRDAIQP